MAENSDDNTAVNTNQNITAVNENPSTISNENTPTLTTTENSTTNANESTTSEDTNNNAVGNEKDEQPVSIDTATTIETHDTPPASTDTPSTNELTNTTSVDQSIDPQTATTNASSDNKSEEIQPLATDDIGRNELNNVDLSLTDSLAINKPIDLNFSPPIETLLANATPIASTYTAAVNVTNNVQMPRPSAIFSLGDDTPSPTSQLPGFVPTTDTAATTLKPIEPITTAESPANVPVSTQKKSPGITSNQQNSFVSYIRQSTDKLVLFAIVLIISLLQLIIGWRYADDCPVHWRIPHYLVVAGCIGLAIFILCVIRTILHFYIQSRPNNTGFIILRSRSIMTILEIILFILAIIWWVCGCFWVFRAWRKVQYNDARLVNYCHPILYRFAFWLLLITVICAGIFFFAIIKEIRRLSVDRKKGPATLVPTSEP